MNYVGALCAEPNKSGASDHKNNKEADLALATWRHISDFIFAEATRMIETLSLAR